MSALPISALSSLGSDFAISPLGGLGAGAQVAPAAGSSSGGGGFAGALTDALQSLQSTQDTANTAAQQLATGQTSDPTAAVTAVENAQLAMELASQVTTKAVSAVQTLFQTQM